MHSDPMLSIYAAVTQKTKFKIAGARRDRTHRAGCGNLPEIAFSPPLQ
jgi:hypothetical protein